MYNVLFISSILACWSAKRKCSTPSRLHGGLGSGWLGKCYGSAKRFMGAGTRRGSRDIEAAVKDESGPMTEFIPEPTSLRSGLSHRVQSRDRDMDSDVNDIERLLTTASNDQQSSTRPGLASGAIGQHSSSRLLSDEENDRMNRKIDRLMAAIDDRRPIHFAAPNAEIGEVDIFADHYSGVNEQSEYELERDIAANPHNFGRIIRYNNGIRRIRSPYSLQYADPSESWASTESSKSSSNAWERAVAAANIRFTLEHGDLDLEPVVVKQPFGSWEMKHEASRSRRRARSISPIPLDFHKPLRTSTPSIHSNGTEQDTSSPLFQKSCERIRRDAYAEPPQSTFERGVPGTSQLDEWAFVSEPRGGPSHKARESKVSSNPERAFGVFKDASNGESSSKDFGKRAVRSKALKDISNLQRPGYLKFNSFANDVDLKKGETRRIVSATASSVGFEGALDPESRRAYIKSKWPELLKDHATVNMTEPDQLDGVARRRNEQAIGRPLDNSHYSLSHVRTSMADSSLNVDPVRQAHFDLALARLEGRALPPPPSPIRRHPDSAALFDRDILIEGSHRPLPLRGPRPRRSAIPRLRRAFERYL